LADRAIAERILYRLVKRHIAGTTMSSAIEKAKEFNDKKLPVSIAFLSESAHDSTKARYATTTYLELIRRIARLGLKASVQVPLDQIGFDISDDVAGKNANEILNTARNYGVFVWLEIRDHRYSLPNFLRDAKGVGYAVSADHTDDYLRANRGHIRSLKILCSEAHGDGKEMSKRVSGSVKAAAKMIRNVVVQSAPDTIVRELLNGSNVKKAVIFELQLGYSSNKLSKMVKRGARVSIYVPFGKDWEHYAVSRTPERYARFLAARILKEA
jgi:proline dehydrogenase